MILMNTVKMKGVVLDMAKSLTFPLPLLAVAYQQLLAGMNLNTVAVASFLFK